MLRICAVMIVCLLVSGVALATPYVGPEEAMKVTSGDHGVRISGGRAAPFDYEYAPLARFTNSALFITTLQVDDTLSAAYGGMREGEHLLTIIQTDNTSESIWIWTHYYDLTGDDAYHANIDAAWQYCMNNPAYDEEGDDSPTTGYYRRYNCSWALRAEMEYSRVYGDNTYAWYGDSCASYLCHNPLILKVPYGMYRKLNGLIMGWAVGNLYEYGQDTGNPVFVSKAVDMADSVRDWVDANPNKIHWMEWAMEGGAVMWGVVNSWFQEYPAGLEDWVNTIAPYLDTEIDSSQYQNAWRGWAALGQNTAAEVLDSPVYAGYFKHLADTLVLNDGDLDGGIPVIDAEPDDHDQSWVTNYLGFMCMDRLLTFSGLASRGDNRTHGLTAVATPVPAFDPPALRFAIPGPSRVSLDVFDVRGRSVHKQDLGVLDGGSHTVALFRTPGDLPSSAGVYFYVLRAGTDVAKGKVIMLR
jgi:hypothetical protein